MQQLKQIYAEATTDQKGEIWKGCCDSVSGFFIVCLRVLIRLVMQTLGYLLLALIILLSIDALVDESIIVSGPTNPHHPDYGVIGKSYPEFDDCFKCVADNHLRGEPPVYRQWCDGATDPELYPEEADPKTAPPRCWDVLRYYYDVDGKYHANGVHYSETGEWADSKWDTATGTTRLMRAGITSRRCPYTSTSKFSCYWYSFFTRVKGTTVNRILGYTVQPLVYRFIVPTWGWIVFIVVPLWRLAYHIVVVPIGVSLCAMIGGGITHWALNDCIFSSKEMFAENHARKRETPGTVLYFRDQLASKFFGGARIVPPVFDYFIPWLVALSIIYGFICFSWGIYFFYPRHVFGFRTDGLVTSELHPLPEGVAYWSWLDIFDFGFVFVFVTGVMILYIFAERDEQRKARLEEAKLTKKGLVGDLLSGVGKLVDAADKVEAVAKAAAKVEAVVGDAKAVVDTARSKTD